MDQVDEVKQKTDIVSLINGYVPLKKAGRNYKANCPFHSEKTPSFMVSPELQIYKCFGCGESGDCFSFLQKYEGMDFAEALKFLADRVGIKLESRGFADRGEKEILYDVNLAATRFYNYVLLGHPAGKKALDYLTRKRGLKLDTLKLFQIGFAPGVSQPIADFLIKRKKFNIGDLLKSGTFYSGRTGLTDRFEGRVMFPIFNHRDKVVGFSGRLLPDDPRHEVGKYVNTPETPVYHKSSLLYGLNFSKSEIKSQREAVIVEGQMDFVSTYQAGIKNVVAIAGTALTKEQVDLLVRFTPKIILSLDADVAGDTASRRGIVTAQEVGLDIVVASLGSYKDPDEAVRANPEAFKRSLTKAVGVWDFYINSTFSKYDSTSGEGKSKISREIVPILASIPDSIVAAHYITLVAEKLNVAQSAVFEEVDKRRSGGVLQKEDEEKAEEKDEKSRRVLLEERLLAIAFQLNPKKLNPAEYERYVSSHVLERIVDEYLKFSKKSGKFKISSFSNTLAKELLGKFSELVLIDLDDLIRDEEKADKEIELIKIEIEILENEDIRLKLKEKMEELEKSGDEKSLKRIEKEFDQASTKRNELEDRRDSGIIL